MFQSQYSSFIWEITTEEKEVYLVKFDEILINSTGNVMLIIN
jgi:hypothetical protein